MLMYDPYIDLEEQIAWVPVEEGIPTYGHLMFVLMERSVDEWPDADGVLQPKLTMEQRGVHCEAWARHYAATAPELAAELHIVALQYARELARTQEEA